MGFNFNGMMQGLGGGLVATGQIMKEQEKMNWETEQLKLKYDRDQHMQSLRLTAEKEGRQAGFTHSENLAAEQNRQADARWNTTEENTAAYRKQQGELQLQESQANASARASTAAHQGKVLEGQQSAAKLDAEYKKLIAEKKTPAEELYKVAENIADAKFKDDPEKRDIFLFNLVNSKDKEGKPIDPSIVVKAMDISEARVAGMEDEAVQANAAKLELPKNLSIDQQRAAVSKYFTVLQLDGMKKTEATETGKTSQTIDTKKSGDKIFPNNEQFLKALNDYNSGTMSTSAFEALNKESQARLVQAANREAPDTKKTQYPTAPRQSGGNVGVLKDRASASSANIPPARIGQGKVIAQNVGDLQMEGFVDPVKFNR